MIYLVIIFSVLFFLFTFRILRGFRKKKSKRVKIVSVLNIIFFLSLILSFVSPPHYGKSSGQFWTKEYNGPITFLAVYKNAFRGLIGQELEINNNYRIRDDANEAASYLREKEYSLYFEYLAMIFAKLLPYLMLTIITLTCISFSLSKKEIKPSQ
jgi:hypothetical protein